jgi:Flp pilus assembly protein TadB
MPNRYEREIEEILRNLEHGDPKSARGQKFGERFYRGAEPRIRTQQPRSSSWDLSPVARVLLVAIVCALVAGGVAYIVGANIFTLILAIISLVCVIIVALSQFLFQARRPRSIRYGNVTITPLRRGPLSFIRTQWNLLKLKFRYRRKNQ